jgi:hypothetical protein
MSASAGSSSSSSASEAKPTGTRVEQPKQIVTTATTRSREWNGVHCLAIVAATIFAYLGYNLFVRGVNLQSQGVMNAKLPLHIAFDLSGTGPGLFFMAFGAMIILVALATVPASKKEKPTQEA